MNTLVNALNNEFNYTTTENGATAYKFTESKVLDMFAHGAAYRTRSSDDCILLFKEAFEENPDLAMKCLFWIRDCRGGAGERRYFRTVFHWLCDNYPITARKNLNAVVEMGRWDDLVYSTYETPVWNDAVEMILTQIDEDLLTSTPSICAKWLPSIGASSKTTKAMGYALKNALHLTDKRYRQVLSTLRKRINIVERLMSENRWNEIDFSKLPSRAGILYSDCFKNKEEIAQKYADFINSKETKVNTGVLYPYEMVAKATHVNMNDKTARNICNKYWEELPDYLEGKKANLLCVVDTSGSMTGNSASAPINVAISLGMYCAERLNGPFHNKYISFASKPQLIDIKGVDFCDKVQRIYDTNLCDNTDLTAVFKLLKNTILKYHVAPEDIPTSIIVLSDMEIDIATSSCWGRNVERWTEESTSTEMEEIRKDWARAGLKLPKLVYWDIQSRHDRVLDAGPDVSFVSGMSPTLFKSVLTGKTGYELMLETLGADRYSNIKA